jgi:precorrin-8X/cobalt-precorrin-8 methylmutase
VSELASPSGRTARRVPHPIELESYMIMRGRLDTSDLPPLTRAVVERIVHTTADPSWAGDLVCDEAALQAGRAALLAGAPLIADVRMVAVGITSRPCTVALDLAPGGDPDVVVGGTEPAGLTRSAAGIRAAALRHPSGAVWAIGNAPTALAELLRCAAAGQLETPLVVGLPVGFVGSVAAKAALRATGLPAVSNRGERGGAAVAAAAINALLYLEDGLYPEDAR